MSEVRSPLVRGGVLEPGGRWRNWGRSESAHPQYVATVASVDEVIETLAFARDEGLTVKPIGAGHSFTAIGATNGVQVDLSAIDAGDRFNHDLFAASPDAVRLIGGRLLQGQVITDSDVPAPLAAAGVIGSAASLLVTAPIRVFDAAAAP